MTNIDEVVDLIQQYGAEQSEKIDSLNLSIGSMTVTNQAQAAEIQALNENVASLEEDNALLQDEIDRLQAIIDNVTPPPPPPPAATMLMGVSNSPNNHGGFPKWDVVRVYQFSQAVGAFNEFSPKVISLTDSNTNLQGGAASATALKNFLETFYYGTGSAERQNCEIHFANGNEYGDKVTNQSAFADTVRRMYEVIHTVSGGVRRYPKAKMGLDPTHYQEKQGMIVKSITSDVAPYLDFIAWSMYPPGRESTSADPTFTKPGTDPVSTGGFLERCFQRTLAAQKLAGHSLEIECWEIGIGDDPDDKDHRPYYLANSLISWCEKRAKALGLKMPVFIWWDAEVAGGNSQNILSDEPANTLPSTAKVLREWRTFLPEYGGTKPASWPTAPKSTWPTGA